MGIGGPLFEGVKNISPQIIQILNPTINPSSEKNSVQLVY